MALEVTEDVDFNQKSIIQGGEFRLFFWNRCLMEGRDKNARKNYLNYAKESF